MFLSFSNISGTIIRRQLASALSQGICVTWLILVPCGDTWTSFVERKWDGGLSFERQRVVLREASAGRKEYGHIPLRSHQSFYCAQGTFRTCEWLPWNRAGAEPGTENNLCHRWQNKTSTAHWITTVGFDWRSHVWPEPSAHSWEGLPPEKLRYALSKQTRSRTQNSRAAGFAMLKKKKKKVSPSDSYTVLKSPRDQSRYLI